MIRRLFVLTAACLTISACSTAGTKFLAGRQALIRGEVDNALVYFESVAQTDSTFIADPPTPRRTIWTYIGRAHYNAGRYVEAHGAFSKAIAQLNDDYIARLYLGLTMLRGQAPAAPTNAFSLQEIAYALREGIAPRRVATLARERGVAFDLSPETEQQLKISGADLNLLDELKKLRAERASQNTSPNTQRIEGSKEVASALTGIRDWLNFTIGYSAQGRFWDPDREIRSELDRVLQTASANQRNFEEILSSGEWIGFRLEEEYDRARRDEEIDRQRRSR